MRKPTHMNKNLSFKPVAGQRLRVFERARIAGQVLIHDEEHLFLAPINNISAGGLFIEQLMSLPTGSVVRIVVKSPKLELPVQAMGTVVRIENDKRQGTAIEFTSITSRAREVIQNYVFETRMEGALKVA